MFDYLTDNQIEITNFYSSNVEVKMNNQGTRIFGTTILYFYSLFPASTSSFSVVFVVLIASCSKSNFFFFLPHKVHLMSLSALDLFIVALCVDKLSLKIQFIIKLFVYKSFPSLFKLFTLNNTKNISH